MKILKCKIDMFNHCHEKKIIQDLNVKRKLSKIDIFIHKLFYCDISLKKIKQ